MRATAGRFLGLVADGCVAVAAVLLDWRERIDPGADELTDEQADRILAGVRARLVEEQAAPKSFMEPFDVPPGTFISRFQGFH